MKKIACFCLVAALAFSSCKKNSSSPSIVGTWRIANISGNMISQNSPTGPTITTNYSYTAPVLAETGTDTVMVTIADETWAFNSDGTFSISENYTTGNASSATTHLISGWWDYTSSTIPNSDILLRSTGTPTIVPAGGTFFIKSVTSSQLVLTVYETSTYSAGGSLTHNFELTFSRE